MDKMDAFYRYEFHKIVVGDDGYKTEKWQDFDQDFDQDFAAVGLDIAYFPHTKLISSTLINNTLAAPGADD